MPQKTICLDIGGSKILGAVVDENNKIGIRIKKKTKPEQGRDAVDKRIIDVITELMDKAGLKKEDVRAIGAGAPGVIDTASGTILFAPNIPWKDHNIGKVIQEAIGVPFLIGNDVNVGMLGEWKYGAGKGYSHVAGLFVGTGIGGGVIIDNKLFTGARFAGTELGHMILNSEGPMCNCGQKGCLEAYASKIAMTRDIRAMAARGYKTQLLDSMEEEGNVIKSSAFKKAVDEKDPVALTVLDRACYYLAVGMGNLINIFNPEVFVLGGGVLEALEAEIMSRVTAQIGQFTWPAMLSQVKIKPSVLKDDAILFGAQALISEKA